jgi:hypothetical protein
MSPESAKVFMLDEDFPTVEKDKNKYLAGSDVFSMGLALYYLRQAGSKQGDSRQGCSQLGGGAIGTIQAISEIKNYKDLCIKCQIFCSSNPAESDVLASLNAYDQIVYRMLDSNLNTRITAKEAARMFHKINQGAKN